MTLESTTIQKPAIGRRRKAITVSTSDLVSRRYLNERRLPLVIEPRAGVVDLSEWLSGNRSQIEEDLQIHGGILFRGFGVDSAEHLERAVNGVAGEALAYNERSSPRTRIAGNIYTSTDYPQDQAIFLHNENSYQKRWPLKIFFCCVTAAEHGGESPIADVRRVFERISDGTKERFRSRKVMYTRTFSRGTGLSWEEVFQTTDRAAVEEHCSHAGIKLEWLSGGRLRTRAVREAMMRHPKTGAWVWFNHATFFHISTREPQVRDSLLELFAEDELPTNSYYGDGRAIEPEVLEELRAAYDAETIRFRWERGDLLLLDNMLVAHGRSPFSGERKVLVGMAEAWDLPA